MRGRNANIRIVRGDRIPGRACGVLKLIARLNLHAVSALSISEGDLAGEPCKGRCGNPRALERLKIDDRRSEHDLKQILRVGKTIPGTDGVATTFGNDEHMLRDKD